MFDTRHSRPGAQHPAQLLRAPLLDARRLPPHPQARSPIRSRALCAPPTRSRAAQRLQQKRRFVAAPGPALTGRSRDRSAIGRWHLAEVLPQPIVSGSAAPSTASDCLRLSLSTARARASHRFQYYSQSGSLLPNPIELPVFATNGCANSTAQIEARAARARLTTAAALSHNAAVPAAAAALPGAAASPPSACVQPQPHLLFLRACAARCS